MYYIPINRKKAIEIQTIAKITKQASKDEDDQDLLKNLEKIHIHGIPDIGKALYQSINQLEREEQRAFKLIVESGRGTITDLTETSVKNYIKSSLPLAPDEIGEMLGYIDFPQYINDGIIKLDKWLR